MEFWKLLMWCWGVAGLGLLSFMGSVFAIPGVVDPERAASRKLVDALFAPTYLLFVPGAIILALVLHFTRLADYEMLPLVLAALACIVFPAFMMFTISR